MDMKTIEERAKEYAEKCYVQNTEWGFIAGAQAEHELLTRWHDPKEERPKPNHIVLTKWKYKDGSGEIISVGGFNGEEWDAHAIVYPELFDVIGWRELQE